MKLKEKTKRKWVLNEKEAEVLFGVLANITQSYLEECLADQLGEESVAPALAMLDDLHDEWDEY